MIWLSIQGLLSIFDVEGPFNLGCVGVAFVATYKDTGKVHVNRQSHNKDNYHWETAVIASGIMPCFDPGSKSDSLISLFPLSTSDEPYTD